MKKKENTMQNSVNQRLKIFFESQGLGNAMISKATEISEPTISKILNGHTEPHKSTLSKITKTYVNLNPEWLFTGKGEMLQEPSSKIDWKEEAYQVMKDENTFLKKQLELLSSVVNSYLNGKNPNFQPSPLHVGKIIELFGEGSCAGDYELANVG